MSDRLIQSSIYVDESFGKNIKYVTIYFERMFDILPDIEVLTTVDENTGRAFELITQQRWIDRFIVRIRRLDQHGGWNEPVKILWRAGAPSGYKCSIRGAFQQQYIMRPGRRLRIVLQSLEVLVEAVSIDIFRNVTVEVDPRLTVIDPTLPPDRLALARPTITGKNLVESMFRISESNFHVFGINIVGGRGGKGGAFFVAGGLLHLSNCVVSHNNALLGGAIYLQASTLEAVETTLANNTAELTLHDGVSGGGAVYIDEEAIAIMSDSLLLGNVARAGKATSSGGAVDVWGKLRAADCVFHGNSAQGSKITAGYVSAIANGGAIACHSGGDVILERATLTNNSATTSGGLLYSIGSIVIRDSFGGNNSAPLGSNARVSMASDYIFVNTPFLTTTKRSPREPGERWVKLNSRR